MSVRNERRGHVRRVAGIIAASAAVALGCESIAGVEDVSFDSDSTPQGCDAYCELLAEACPGDLAVYEDTDTCLAVCASFERGDATKAEGNTLSCRLRQAQFAQSIGDFIEKRPHCTAAGPGGGGLCTDNAALPSCEGYCALYMDACESISTTWGFASLGECIKECGALPPSPDYSAVSAPDSGDTLACRLYYASAAMLDADTYCKRAGLRPEGSCVGDVSEPPSCENYCRAIGVACSGELEVYENRAQCEAVCAELDAGSKTDSGHQDTVGCRSAHAYNALLTQPSIHCPHAGPAGDGMCSEPEDANCRPYCRLAEAACPADFSAIYGNGAGCLAACRALEDSAPGNHYSTRQGESGDTLKCRILHVSRALEEPDGNAAVCGAVFGEAPCQ